MADEERLSGKVGLDTTDFKTGLAAMNRELRVIESGFRASAASLGDWANTASGLEMRVKTLTSAIDVQKQKVAAVRAEYERVKTEKGATSRAAQDLEIKLNKETESLGKMESELGKTKGALAGMKSGTDETKRSVQELGQKSEETGTKLGGLKVNLSGLAGVAKAAVTTVLALAAAAGAAAVAVFGLGLSSASAAADLVDMSDKTGISVTRLQELQYFGSQYKLSLDTIATSQARLTRTMDTANEQWDDYNKKLAEADAAEKSYEGIELGDAAEAFRALGVEVTNVDGSLRDQQEVFAETIDALGQIDNAAERDALAMQIFGRGAMELNPLIKAGGDEMARLAEEAHRVGAVMSEEDVAALEAFDDSLAALKLGMKGTLGTLAASLLPGFQSVIDPVQGYLQQLAQIVTNSDGDFGQMADGIAGLFAQIATDIAAAAPQMLTAGLSIVQSILAAVTAALPQLLTAGISIIESLVGFIVQNLPLIIETGVQILLMLVDALVSNLPMLVTAALQAIIALANGLTAALPTLVPAIISALLLIIQTFIENLPLLVEAATQLILALAQGLTAATPLLVPALQQMIPALIQALITIAPALFVAGGQLIVELARGLLAVIPAETQGAISAFLETALTNLAFGAIGMYQKGVELFTNVREGLYTAISSLTEFGTKVTTSLEKAITQVTVKLKSIGKSIVEGIYAGITSAGSWFMTEVQKFIDALIQQIMDSLDAHSPARKLFPAGRAIVQGVSVGAEREFAVASPRMGRMFAGLGNVAAFSRQMSAATGQLAYASAPAGSNSVTNNNGDIQTININGLSVPGASRNTTLGELLDRFNLR